MPSTAQSGTLGEWDVKWSDTAGNNFTRQEESSWPIESKTEPTPRIEFNLTIANAATDRVAKPNQNYIYNLTVKNVGKAATQANELRINVTLKTRPKDYINQNWTLDHTCNVTNAGGGTFDNNTRIISWLLTNIIPADGSIYLNFTLNCTKDETEINLYARALLTVYVIDEEACQDPGIQVCNDPTATNANWTVDLEKPDSNALLTKIAIYARTGAANGCGSGSPSSNEYLGDRFYDDINSSYLGMHYRGGVWAAWSNKTAPSNFASIDYSAISHTIQINSSGNVDAGECICINTLCSAWNYTVSADEPQNLFVKIRSNTPPVIENETMSADGDWGQPFNFSVDAYDQNGDNVNVTLWLNLTNGWTPIETKTCTQCNKTNIMNFSYNFDCSYADKQVLYYFTATDANLFLVQTSTHSFNVEKNDVIFTVFSGNGSLAIANRTADLTNLTLGVNIMDENGTYVGNLDVIIYITRKGLGASAVWDDPTYDFSNGHYLVTDANGNITYNFTAGLHCDNSSTPLTDEEYEVGPHDWYIKVNNTLETCYKPLNSYQAPNEYNYYRFTTYDKLNNTIDQPTGNNTIQQGRDNVSILTYIYNYCKEPMEIPTSQVTFNLSTIGASYLCSDIKKVGANVYTCEWDTLNRTNGVYNFTMSSYENYYYNDTNSTEPNAFTLETVPLLKGADVTPRTGVWGKDFNFTVNVTDNFNDTVNVSFYIIVPGVGQIYQGSRNCSNCSENQLGYTSLNWTNITYPCSGYAEKTITFKFVAEDKEGHLPYETSIAEGDYVGNDNTFYIKKHDVRIDFISGNETTASTSFPAEFILRVYDLNLSTYNLTSTITLGFNVTTNGISGDYKKVGTSSSNSTGHVVYSFTPDGSFSGEKQSWKGYVDVSEGCYYFNESDKFNVTVQPAKYIYLENTTVNLQTGEWGFNFTFNVTSRTNSNNNITFTLLIYNSTHWVEIDNKTENVTDQWKLINFTWDPSCSDKGNKQFKISATDNAGNTNNTDSKNFEVQRDTVLLE
jgi:hypothetical protein